MGFWSSVFGDGSFERNNPTTGRRERSGTFERRNPETGQRERIGQEKSTANNFSKCATKHSNYYVQNDMEGYRRIINNYSGDLIPIANGFTTDTYPCAMCDTPTPPGGTIYTSPRDFNPSFMLCERCAGQSGNPVNRHRKFGD